MKLEEREAQILETLKEISRHSAILVGGYAVNAYAPPRFSIDCDLVTDNATEIGKTLQKNNFKLTEHGKLQTPYQGEFVRYEKGEISFDLLVGGILDRKTGAFLPYDLISKHSAERETVGKASPIKIKIRIANPETLFVMKFISCRRQDIRDIFMLSNLNLDTDFIMQTLKLGYNHTLKNTTRIKETIESKAFRDSLQGVYGFVQEKAFQRSKTNLLLILEKLHAF